MQLRRRKRICKQIPGNLSLLWQMGSLIQIEFSICAFTGRSKQNMSTVPSVFVRGSEYRKAALCLALKKDNSQKVDINQSQLSKVIKASVNQERWLLASFRDMAIFPVLSTERFYSKTLCLTSCPSKVIFALGERNKNFLGNTEHINSYVCDFNMEYHFEETACLFLRHVFEKHNFTFVQWYPYSVNDTEMIFCWKVTGLWRIRLWMKRVICLPINDISIIPGGL